jgi:hypothetical protein
MKFKWEIDDATTIEARFGSFGKEVVTVNDKEVVSRRSMRMKGDLAFALPDGRAGTIAVASRYLGKPNVDLRVDGRLFAASGKHPIKCQACGASARPYDRFCNDCGKPLPTPEQRGQERQVKDATGAIRALAWLFAIFGLIMFFVLRSQSSDALGKIAGMDGAATIPIEGVTYTVAQLRDQLRWEPWSVLVTNALLAVVMAGLALWGRRSPLPAVIVATATYAVVIVINAIVDPKTIAQGIIVKIIIIGLFVKGIKAALALRAANG